MRKFVGGKVVTSISVKIMKWEISRKKTKDFNRRRTLNANFDVSKPRSKPFATYLEVSIYSV